MQHYRVLLDLQMFAQDSAQEKTEKATPKKRQDARKKGQVAKSMEIPSALILLFSMLAFFMFGGYFKDRINNIFNATFYDYLLMDINKENIAAIFTSLITQGLLILLPIFLIAVLTGFLGNYIQIGLLLTGEPLKPQLSKLDPIKGFKKIFAIRAVVEFLKSVFKVSVVALVVFLIINSEIKNILHLSEMPIEASLLMGAQLTLRIGMFIAAVLLILAIFDYMYQKYEHEKELKMSKQDIKDEHKNMEGDPKIKARIRQTQMKMAMQRMMQEVPKADVVITNPTHFAIAIKYDPSQMDAPTVIAKGMDYNALKIR